MEAVQGLKTIESCAHLKLCFVVMVMITLHLSSKLAALQDVPLK
jgi:hypothetical protein